MWFVYIIESECGKLYTGITTNLERRFAEHKSGQLGAKFFRTTNAGKIVFCEIYENRSLASKRESAIKKMKRNEKLSLVEK